jgi:hypothetical protein
MTSYNPRLECGHKPEKQTNEFLLSDENENCYTTGALTLHHENMGIKEHLNAWTNCRKGKYVI